MSNSDDFGLRLKNCTAEVALKANSLQGTRCGFVCGLTANFYASVY